MGRTRLRYSGLGSGSAPILAGFEKRLSHRAGDNLSDHLYPPTCLVDLLHLLRPSLPVGFGDGFRPTTTALAQRRCRLANRSGYQRRLFGILTLVLAHSDSSFGSRVIGAGKLSLCQRPPPALAVKAAVVD